MKAYIEQSLRDPNGHIRLVIVSASLGRDANYPNIHRVIFLKSPRSLEELEQFAGRAGRLRHGQDYIADIIVYWRIIDVPKNRTSKGMLRWLHCPSTECRRQISLDYFKFPGDANVVLKPTDLCLCCDLCARECECTECAPTTPIKSRSRKSPSTSPCPSPSQSSPCSLPSSPEPSPPSSSKRSRFEVDDDSDIDVDITTEPSIDEKLLEALRDYTINKHSQSTCGMSLIALNEQSINRLVEQAHHISSATDLVLFYDMSLQQADEVWSIMQLHLPDSEVQDDQFESLNFLWLQNKKL